MIKIVLSLILSTACFAITPFSTEGLKNVNIKVFDKSKLVSKQTLLKIQEETTKELQKLGIRDNSDAFSNFIIKIQIEKVSEVYVVHNSILVIEDISPTRDKTLQALGLSYYKDDMIQTKELDTDLYESIVDYLVFDFCEQYKSEN